MKIWIFIILVVWVLTFIALLTDVFSITSKYGAFGRMGSIMVLFGAILEYKIVNRGQENSSFDRKREPTFSEVGEFGKKVLLTDSEKRIQYFAHFTVIIGTLVWGFGDLINTIP